MKKHLILTVCVQIILTSLLWGVAGYASTEKELFEKGVALLNEQKYQQAVDIFSTVIEHRPDAADAYKNRGVAYMKQKKFDLAVADFLKALEIQPESEGVYSNMGVARYYQKKHAQAIENYNKALLKSPESYFAYFNRAICWAELKDYEKSLADVNKTLEIMPGFYSAACMKGDLYAKMGKIDMAGKAYQKAIAIDPDQPYAKNRLSDLKQGRKEYEIAMQKTKTLPVKSAPKQPVAQPVKQGSPGLIETPPPLKRKAVPPKPATVRAKTYVQAQTPVQTQAPVQAQKPVQAQAPVQTQTSLADTSADQDDTPKIYEFQTGAYRNKINAQIALAKLKKMGINSRIAVFSNKGKPWYMVRSGNYSSYPLAVKAHAAFEKRTGMAAMVKKSTNQ